MNKSKQFIARHAWVFLLFLVFNTVLNAGTSLAGLYQDDLYLWSRFAENHAFDYIVTFGSTRCRPVWQFISYVLLKLMGTHTEILVPVNIIMNTLLAWTVYLIAARWSGRRGAGVLAGIAFSVSKLSYYHIGMVLGLMEASAMLGALMILYFLYEYLQVPKNQGQRYLMGSFTVYFVTVFIHERYMALVVVLLLAPLLKRDYKKLWIPAAELILVVLIRLWITGRVSPPGTGGTNIADTFDVAQAFRFAFQQVFYIFGISTGPEHFSGITFMDSSRTVQLLIEAGIACLLLLVVCYGVVWYRERKQLLGEWKVLLLFAVFIAMCIGSTSVTIRLEMRWVYVSYAAALLYLSHMYGVIREAGAPVIRRAAVFLLAGYLICLIPSEMYAWSYRPNLYYYSNQRRSNSLMEVTYGKYGEELFDKEIYLLNNDFEIDDWTLETFFRVYRKDRLPGIPKIHIVNGVEDFGFVTENMLVLAEDEKDNTYVDVTEFVKRQKFDRIKGCYEDGWVDEHSEMVVQAGADGIISMLCYYPYELRGYETARIYQNGSLLTEIEMTENHVPYIIEAEPYEKVSLRIDCNFTLENPPEKRGDDELAMVIYFDIQ